MVYKGTCTGLWSSPCGQVGTVGRAVFSQVCSAWDKYFSALRHFIAKVILPKTSSSGSDFMRKQRRVQPRQNSRAVVQDQAQDLPQLDIITVLVIKSLFSSDWKDNLLSVADHNPNQFHIVEPEYTLEWQIPLRNRYHSIAVNKAPLLVVSIYCLSVQLLFSLCCCWTYLQTPFQGGAGIARRANNPQICYIIWHDFKGREKRRFILLCKIYLVKFTY